MLENNNSTTYRVAQSADASCDGLDQPSNGPLSMMLTKMEKFDRLCNFPSWATHNGQWQTLNRSHIYDFASNHSTFTVHHNEGAGDAIRIAHCVEEEPNTDTFVVHSTSGW